MLADALAGRKDAERTAIAAAFTEACGWPLAREVALRAVVRDGLLIAVASTRAWADQVEALAPALLGRINQRLGREAARAIEVRVGPLGR